MVKTQSLKKGKIIKMKVYHILGSAPYFTNCFLLSDEKDSAVLIDCSMPIEKIKEALENEGVLLKAVLLTHGHHDHIESLKAVQSEFEGIEVYLDKEDAVHFDIKDTIDYQNEVFSIGKMDFEIIKTPGHTRGSVCVVVEDFMFSGDTLFAGTVGRTDLPGGDYDTLLNSLKIIVDKVDDNCKVCPGHNHFSSIKSEKEQNPYIKTILRDK